ncbi:MAG: hypothetical protein E7254_02835 [Lachnospiraceae bacterium]|nr:hypothetical protein [Lachnospiraceae bacterium]
MKKTKKILALILSVILVVVSNNYAPVDVHADWEDNKCCVECGEWTDDYCEDCAADRMCVCSSCHDFYHCNLCGGCYLNLDVDPCDDGCFNVICKDCAAQEGYHCPECEECFMGDEDELCGNCFRCPDCVDICDECGWCYECQEHCPECYNCDYEDERCEMGGEHCQECCDLCFQCEECIEGKNQEACGYCGLCEDCCAENACEACGMCAEDSEYDEHLCPNCGVCMEEEAERCDTCGLCTDCCLEEAISQGCECGELCQSEVDDDHICENCGQCYGVVDKSIEAEEEGMNLCVDCYEETVETDEENHEARPQNSWTFDNNYHWKACRFCNDDEHISQKNLHEFDSKGKCKVCGYVDGSSIYITRQPISKRVEVGNADGNWEDNYVYMNISATAKKPLTYQWQWSSKKDFSNYVSDLTDDDYNKGSKTNSLSYLVGTDSCYGLYGPNDNEIYIRCVVSDGNNTVYSNIVTITVKHVFDADYDIISDENGHYFKCHGEGCDHYGKAEKHIYDQWTWNADRTVRTAYCKVCGYKSTRETHKHSIDQYVFMESECTNNNTNEWTAKVGEKTYIVDERHHEGICDVEDDCDFHISEAHTWGPWHVVTATPTTAEKKGGIHRYCTVCEYEESRVQKDKDGNDLYWEFGTHPVNIIGGYMDNVQGLVKEGETVRLTPDKKPGYEFYGWKVKREVLNTSNNTYSTYSYDITAPTNAYYGFPEDLYLFTMPKMNDAGIWTIEAKYAEGCPHSLTEISGKCEATCGHVGYTGDRVCSECGYVVEQGTEIDKLPHRHVVTATENSFVRDKKGNIVYDRHGDAICEYRKYDPGDCEHDTKGYSGDKICTDCNRVVERGKIIAPVHNWTVNKVLEEPTTTRKGRATYICEYCGKSKEMPMDYSGPDYSVGISKRNLTFSFVYGLSANPIVIDFTRKGRDAGDIVKICDYEWSGDNNVIINQTGDMQITVAVNSFDLGSLDNCIDVCFELKDGSKIWLTSIINNDEWPINVKFNLLKDKQTFKATIINAEFYDHTNKQFLGNTMELHSGELIYARTNKESDKLMKAEWIILDDESGYLQKRLELNEHTRKDWQYGEYMPHNDVTILALTPDFTGDVQTGGKTVYYKDGALANGIIERDGKKYKYIDGVGVPISDKDNETSTSANIKTKVANPITVKAKKIKIKLSKLKKKNQIIKAKKAIKVLKAQGNVTYKLSSVKKGKKNFKKYFKVAKNGKITVKKGLKKGTYKVQIKVTASGNDKYEAGSKIATVKITVK